MVPNFQPESVIMCYERPALNQTGLFQTTFITQAGKKVLNQFNLIVVSLCPGHATFYVDTIIMETTMKHGNILFYKNNSYCG